MKKLTLKDLTQSQLQQIKMQQAQAKRELGRDLTNGEATKIKDRVIELIMQQQEKEARKRRAEQKKQKYQPGDESFDWSKRNHSRGVR